MKPRWFFLNKMYCGKEKSLFPVTGYFFKVIEMKTFWKTRTYFTRVGFVPLSPVLASYRCPTGNCHQRPSALRGPCQHADLGQLHGYSTAEHKAEETLSKLLSVGLLVLVDCYYRAYRNSAGRTEMDFWTEEK